MDTRRDDQVVWPQKCDLFGVRISSVSCQQACHAILTAARRGDAAIVSAFSVHALIEATFNPELLEKVNRFAIIVPDGQPVRWALNWLHDTRLQCNVRGADLMWALCRQAVTQGVAVYLYGGTPATLASLAAKLREAFPELRIVGLEAPPFRPLTAVEGLAMVTRVNASGAGLMFIGLGCPKQDFFADTYASQVRPVQVCVGAAFDFHAGSKRAAPVWMQRLGLEWLFRLAQEPSRLWRRYLITNTLFISLLLSQLARKWLWRPPTKLIRPFRQVPRRPAVHRNERHLEPQEKLVP